MKPIRTGKVIILRAEFATTLVIQEPPGMGDYANFKDVLK
jgi:hypothetical protein